VDARTTYRLKVVPLRKPECWRVLEFLPEHTLEQVHGLIQRELELEGEAMWAFFLGGEFLDMETEFPGYPTEGRTARGVPLGALGLEEGMRVAYLFDFETDLRHVLEVSLGEREEGASYPRVLERVGTPPPRERDGEGGPVCPECGLKHLRGSEGEAQEAARREPRFPLPEELRERLVQGFNEQLQRRMWGGARSVERVREWVDSAREALGLCRSEEDVLALEDQVEVYELREWVEDVVEEAREVGLYGEAREVAERLEEVLGDGWSRLLVAEALGWEGRRGEAVQRLKALLEESERHDFHLRLGVAEALLECEQWEEAEEVLRELLAHSWLPGPVWRGAVEALEQLLRATGRRQEANAMLKEQEERARARRALQHGPQKVGRNEPCPCGSGLKAKKCCGARR
jgi:hypothetical protein